MLFNNAHGCIRSYGFPLASLHQKGEPGKVIPCLAIVSFGQLNLLLSISGGTPIRHKDIKVDA